MVPWASYQICEIVGCACAGNAGNVFPTTYVPWCMSGSLTRGGGENVPDIPGARATHNIAYLVRGPLVGFHPHVMQMELAMGRPPHGDESSDWKLVKHIINDPPPQLPTDTFSGEFEDFIVQW